LVQGSSDLSEMTWLIVQVIYATVLAGGVAATRSRILSTMQVASAEASREALLMYVRSAYRRLWRVLSVILGVSGVAMVALGSGIGWIDLAFAVLSFALARPLGELFADWELRQLAGNE